MKLAYAHTDLTRMYQICHSLTLSWLIGFSSIALTGVCIVVTLITCIFFCQSANQNYQSDLLKKISSWIICFSTSLSNNKVSSVQTWSLNVPIWNQNEDKRNKLNEMLLFRKWRFTQRPEIRVRNETHYCYVWYRQTKHSWHETA